MKKFEKILILTSKDHIYANYMLKNLIERGIFENKKIIVFEQDWVVPRKSKMKGLFIYLKTSGLYYAFFQAIKSYMFLLTKTINYILKRKKSVFYPYYKNDLKNFSRRIYQNLKRPEAIEEIRKINPDIILSLLSKEIIPDEIIKIPKQGIINFHPAYLPDYKGISPTFWSLANNEKYAGASLHYIDAGIDTGKIIERRKIKLDFDNEHSLYLACSKAGIEMIVDFFNNKSSKIEKIDNKKGSYYSKPTKEKVLEFRKKYKFFKFLDFLE